MLRRILLTGTVAALTLASLAGAAAATRHAATAAVAPAASPELVLAWIDADWCIKCRAIKNAGTWDDLIGRFEDEPVLFVDLDVTAGRRNADKTLQAEYLAGALGIGDNWDRYGRKTGTLILFEADSGDVVAEFDHATPTEAITKRIKEAAS